MSSSVPLCKIVSRFQNWGPAPSVLVYLYMRLIKPPNSLYMYTTRHTCTLIIQITTPQSFLSIEFDRNDWGVVLYEIYLLTFIFPIFIRIVPSYHSITPFLMIHQNPKLTVFQQQQISRSFATIRRLAALTVSILRQYKTSGSSHSVIYLWLLRETDTT